PDRLDGREVLQRSLCRLASGTGKERVRLEQWRLSSKVADRVNHPEDKRSCQPVFRLPARRPYLPCGVDKAEGVRLAPIASGLGPPIWKGLCRRNQLDQRAP